MASTNRLSNRTNLVLGHQALETLREKEKDGTAPIESVFISWHYFLNRFGSYNNNNLVREEQRLVLNRLCRQPLKKLELYFYGFPLESVPFLSLIRQTKSTLKSLSLRRVCFRGGVRELCESLQEHPSLEELWFDNDFIVQETQEERTTNNNNEGGGDDPYESILRSLATCPSLRYVRFLCHPPASIDPTATPTHYGGIQELICRSTSLQDLTLRLSNRVDVETFIDFIINSLKTNTTIKVFRVCSTLFFNSNTQREQRRVLQAVGEMLKQNSTLETLSFGVLTLLTTRLPEITEALRVNQTLKVLQLRSSATEEESVEFRKMMENNYNLLETRDLRFTDPHEGSIREIMKLNQAGRKRLMMIDDEKEEESGGRRTINKAATVKDWVDVIISVRNDPSLIFYLISKNPSLCRIGLDGKGTRRSWRPRKRPKHFVSFS